MTGTGRAPRPLWQRLGIGAWRLLLAATMVVMTASVGAGVVSRYVFEAPLFWTEEVARYALVWMTFLGGAELFRARGGHISVDVVVDALPPAVRRSVTFTIDVFVLALLIAMGIGGYVLIQASSFAVSAALAIPMRYIYMVIPISAVIAIACLLHRMWRERG